MAPVDLSTVDLAVLTTMRRHDMTTAAPRVNSEKICRQIVIDTGIAEVHGWEALLTLSRPWEVQNPLVDFRGNNGSPSDPPSDARYTEARLSRLGAFVADAAARGEVTPVALMIGDVCRGGRRPPLRSARLVAALDAVIAGRVDADTIPAMCRDLEFATGAEIVTDCSLLLAGDAVTADVCARLDLVGDGEIQITGFPPGVGAQMALEMIRRVAGSRGGEAIRDVDDMSDVAGERLLVRLEASAAANEVVDRLARQWPLRIREELDFSSSLEDLLSEWAGQFATAANARTHLDAFVAAM